MEYDNLWGHLEINEKKRTDKIYEIMKCQCEYLRKDTNDIVFAIFAETRMDGSFASLAKIMLESVRTAPTVKLAKEVGDVSTSQLIDANALYKEAEYGFELYTDAYKLRLFELQMKPVYPIALIVDESINSGISSQLSNICTQTDKCNHYIVCDDNMFCAAIRVIFQSEKVQYIIQELIKMGSTVEEYKKKSVQSFRKIIVCEGRIDEMIIQSIASKLDQDIITVSAEGKQNIPKIVVNIVEQNKKAKILLLADSDGDEKATLAFLNDSTPCDVATVVISGAIEDWFIQDRTNFSKMRLLNEVPEIIEKFDLNEMSKRIPELRDVIEFICS